MLPDAKPMPARRVVNLNNPAARILQFRRQFVLCVLFTC